VEWLEQAVNGIEEASTHYSLVYHDPRLAFQVALVTEATVVPERETVARGVVAGEADLPFFTN
jgi:hypothetical protein